MQLIGNAFEFLTSGTGAFLPPIAMALYVVSTWRAPTKDTYQVVVKSTQPFFIVSAVLAAIKATSPLTTLLSWLYVIAMTQARHAFPGKDASFNVFTYTWVAAQTVLWIIAAQKLTA